MTPIEREKVRYFQGMIIGIAFGAKNVTSDSLFECADEIDNFLKEDEDNEKAKEEAEAKAKIRSALLEFGIHEPIISGKEAES